jgi:predicted lipid-binding transport protein (Tim44 family)
MKQLFAFLAAAFLGFGLLVHDVEAKRLGGGKSLGSQRSSVSPNSATPPSKAAPVQNAAPAAPAAAPKPAGNRWMGMLGGIAAGLGLAWLLSHFGLGDMAGTILMVVLLGVAAFVVFRLLTRRKTEDSMQQGNLQYAGMNAAQPVAGQIPAPPVERAPVSAMGMAPGVNVAAPVQPSIPAGFDTIGFLRQAKLSFVKMQAVHDSGKVDELREFTTDEMFEALKQDIQTSGTTGQTDVVTLNADLLEVTTEGKSHWASVRFSGMIREDSGGAPESFEEIWNLAKPVSGASGWVLAGIQQMQ